MNESYMKCFIYRFTECLCLGTTDLIVSPSKFDILKTTIFAIEALLLGQIFALKTSNFCGATISR